MRNICWNQWLQWQFIMMLIKRGIAWFSPMTARWPDLTELECFYINYNAHDKTQSGIMVIILRGSNCLYNCNKISPSPPQDMICNNEWVERMNCFLVTSLDHLPTVWLNNIIIYWRSAQIISLHIYISQRYQDIQEIKWLLAFNEVIYKESLWCRTDLNFCEQFIRCGGGVR